MTKSAPFPGANFFFIHQYLRIKITLSVINSPQMCFDIWRGIYLSSCENFAPTCSAALTSPCSPRPSLLLLHLCSAERPAKRLQPTSSLTRSIRQTVFVQSPDVVWWLIYHNISAAENITSQLVRRFLKKKKNTKLTKSVISKPCPAVYWRFVMFNEEEEGEI